MERVHEKFGVMRRIVTLFSKIDYYPVRYDNTAEFANVSLAPLSSNFIYHIVQSLKDVMDPVFQTLIVRY
jgi:hypothetical protein